MKAFQKSRATVAAFVSVALVFPSLIWIVLDNGVWRADPVGYALSSLALYKSLTTDIHLWTWQLFTGYKAPMLFWIGQFMVPVGNYIGSINFSLLLIPVTSAFITLFLTFRSIEMLYGNRAITLCGSLIVAGSPLFDGLTTAFWIEPVQVAVTSWFVYAMINAGKWNIFFSLAQFVIAAAIALMIKFSTPLYVIGPAAMFWWKTFRSESVWKIERKSVMFLLIAVVLSLPAVFFYYKNFHAMREFAHFAATSSLFGSQFSKFQLWNDFIAEGIFRPFSLCFSLIILLTGVIIVISQRYFALLDIAVAVAFFQVTLFFIVWMSSVNVDPRYFLPTLPYFSILVCWGLNVISKNLLVLASIAIFSLQYASVVSFAFGCNKMHAVYGMIRPISIHPEKYRNMLTDLLPLASGDSSIVLDLNPELGVAELQYELAKQNLYGNWQSSGVDVSAFLDYENQEIDVSRIDEAKAWQKILSYDPDFYITWKSRFIPELAEREMGRIDKYNAITVHMRWSIANRVKNSGLFVEIPFGHYSELVVYKRCGPGDDRILNRHSIL